MWAGWNLASLCARLAPVGPPEFDGAQRYLALRRSMRAPKSRTPRSRWQCRIGKTSARHQVEYACRPPRACQEGLDSSFPTSLYRAVVGVVSIQGSLRDQADAAAGARDFGKSTAPERGARAPVSVPQSPAATVGDARRVTSTAPGGAAVAKGTGLRSPPLRWRNNWPTFQYSRQVLQHISWIPYTASAFHGRAINS